MACAEAQDALVQNVSAKRVQVDEIWSFCYCKQKNLTKDIAERQIAGDVWTFAAMDADSKLVLSWIVGRRDAVVCSEFAPRCCRAFVESRSAYDGRPQDVSGGRSRSIRSRC